MMQGREGAVMGACVRNAGGRVPNVCSLNGVRQQAG